MPLSKRTAKWMMNLYPPLLFNRIFIQKISDDFMSLDVVIKKSIFNKNIQGTIFGGTLFSAADPYYAMMYWQIFSHRKMKMEAWVRACEVNYLKPATTDMFLEYRLTEQDIAEAIQTVKAEGRFKKWHLIQMLDKNKQVCVEAKVLVYIRPAIAEDKSVF